MADGQFKQNADGSWSQQVELTGSKAQDLGLVIDAANMAAGAAVNGNFIDSVEWVRNIVAHAQSDQQFDIQVFTRDVGMKASLYSAGRNLQTNMTATGASTSQWFVGTYTGASGLLGYSAQFRLKNSAAVPNTFGRLRIQLLGL